MRGEFTDVRNAVTPAEALAVLRAQAPEVLKNLKGLADFLRQCRKKIAATRTAAPGVPAPTQAPALTLLSEDARRYGEAGEIFSKAGFFGPAASQITYGLKIPSDKVPRITFPTAFLENCRKAGGQLRLFSDQTPDGSPLTMPAIQRLVAERWAREEKGRLLNEVDRWQAGQDFFERETPRPGWRVVFPAIVQGTTKKDDLAQAALLIAQLDALFRGISLPEAYEKALTEFATEKTNVQALMENHKTWPQASEAIENFALSRLIRPTPVEVLDHMAAALGSMGQRPFEDIFTRLPRRSSVVCLVGVGAFNPSGASVCDGPPDHANQGLGASLSLQSW